MMLSERIWRNSRWEGSLILVDSIVEEECTNTEGCVRENKRGKNRKDEMETPRKLRVRIGVEDVSKVTEEGTALRSRPYLTASLEASLLVVVKTDGEKFRKILEVRKSFSLR